MKQETKKPLYKVLNEDRTKGEWFRDRYNANLLINSTDLINRDSLCSFFHSKDERYLSDNERANIDYTALAVNNLHHLAEALEGMINRFTEDFPTVSKNGYCIEFEAAKKALNCIL